MHIKYDKFEMVTSLNKSSRKLKVRLFNQWYILMQVKRPDKFTIGIANETSDNWFVPFADYDNTSFSIVKSDMEYIMSRFKLRYMIVLTTGEYDVGDGEFGNYHLMGIEKMTYREHIEMMDMIRCDRNYKGVPKFYKNKNWVLRVAPKVTMTNWESVREKPIVKLVRYNDVSHCKRIVSTAFRKFISDYYDNDLTSLGDSPKNIIEDGLTDLNIVTYTTGA